jgi:hypothetical protein
MVTANNIIAANTHNFIGPVFAVCQIKAPKAIIHATAPAAEIQPWLFVCDAFRALAVFTAANINRNPALPSVEMLVRSNALATNRVRPAVIKHSFHRLTPDLPLKDCRQFTVSRDTITQPRRTV